MENFYVYAILDTRKPGNYVFQEYSFNYEPFYIGKGSGNRVLHHFEKSILKRESHRMKTKIIVKIFNETGKFPIVYKIKENLSEKDAFNLEIQLIKTIGRRNLNKGPLANLSDGGEGPVGFLYDERLREIRRIQNSGIRNNMYGRFGNTHPRFGKPHTPDSKNKIKNNHADCSGSKNPRAITFEFIDPLKNSHIIKGAFEEFCKVNNLPTSIMYRISKKSRTDNFYNGWTVNRI